MTRAKTEGGMDFRELESFNVALLGKMTSRIMSETNSLWVQVLKGLYFPYSDFSQAGKGSRASWAWASLLSGRKVFSEAAVWSIGDGQTVRLFVDAWIPGLHTTRQGTHPVSQEQAHLRLHQWIDSRSRTWLEEKVRGTVTAGEAQQILAVPIPLVPRSDELRWPHDREGRFTVRSAYHIIRS